MKIQTQYLTTNNSYDSNSPGAIVVHNTDNFAKTATARAHAEGLKNGYMSGMSWHIVVDDKEAFQCLPYSRGAWHVGVNYGGGLFGKINNRNSICIEMCVNAGYSYEQAFQNTADVVKQLMQQFGIPAERVYSHYDVCAKNCPSQIRARGDWERFRRLIGSAGTDMDPAEAMVVDKYYRVRRSWADSASQLGAYEVLDNAKNNCPYGYTVFDWEGNAVYVAPKPENGTQSIDFDGLTEAQAAAKILEMAREEGKRAHILPSLIAAQAILESGYCHGTELVRKANNCFGMKCTLSGNTWPSVWDGSSKVNIRTSEQDKAGNQYYIYADFRKYPCIEKSFEDHSCYLLGAMSGSVLRYAGLTGCRTIQEAAQLVKNGGYATDVKYVSELCNIVERFGLDKYDAEVAGKPVPDPAPAPAPVDPGEKVVYRIQVGAFARQAYLSRMLARLTDYRISYFTEPENGQTCVYTGSYEERERAEAQLAMIRKHIGLEQAFIKEAAV